MTRLGQDGNGFETQWSLRPDTVYLNHGSWGPPPNVVREARAKWQALLDEQPMDFFLRKYEPAWTEARNRLAAFVGADEANLIFVDNATHGMNIVADSFPLEPGDEVLLTDHEYGAVRRIWQRACERSGAAVREVELPLPVQDEGPIVAAIGDAITPRTRMLVVSHITSPTAITLPLEAIVKAMRARGVAVCVDGPHAIAQLPLDLERLGCDFYTASCHKWLCAPFGSGFLWVAPQHQSRIRPGNLSWGRLLPNRPQNWSEEFIWSGTRDPSPWFSIPAAIEFLEQAGLERFRTQTHELAAYTRRELVRFSDSEPVVADDPRWYGCMAHVPLPTGDHSSLQAMLWQQHSIEVPIVHWKDRWFIRVSCHLYNRQEQVDQLIAVLGRLLRR